MDYNSSFFQVLLAKSITLVIVLLSNLVYFSATLVLHLCAPLAYKPKTSSMRKGALFSMFWNNPIRLTITYTLELFIFGFMTLKTAFAQSQYLMPSVFLAFFFFIAYFGVCIFITVYVSRKKDVSTWSQSISTIYSGVEEKRAPILQYNIIFIVLRLGLALNVAMTGLYSRTAQCCFFITFTYSDLGLLLSRKMFARHIDRIKALIITFILIILGTFCFVFQESSFSEEKIDELGYACIVCSTCLQSVIALIGVGELIYNLVKFCKTARKVIKSKYQKYKDKRD